MKLNPVHYTKRSSNCFDLDCECEGEQEYAEEDGFIAQEVQDIPELEHSVSHPDSSEMLGLNYNAIFTYAVKAIQEQQVIIEAEKVKVSTLEAQLASVLLRLQELEK